MKILLKITTLPITLLYWIACWVIEQADPNQVERERSTDYNSWVERED